MCPAGHALLISAKLSSIDLRRSERKIRAKAISHGRYVTFQLTEVVEMDAAGASDRLFRPLGAWQVGTALLHSRYRLQP